MTERKYMKCVYFYGSRQVYFCSENISIEMQKELACRQMYFCSENISIEMQKELAYTPPLSKREEKN